jgi:hypothetical protein
MPRYYFDVCDASNVPDFNGTDLANLAVARVEAVRLAGRLLSDQPRSFWEQSDWHIDVTNDDGEHLFRLDVTVTDAPILVSANSNSMPAPQLNSGK